MDFMDISKMRLTVRKFAQKAVEKEKLDKILEAGRWAPTAVDYQPQRILVLNQPQQLVKVKEFCTFGYDQKYVDIDENCDAGDQEHNIYYYGAPLVLLVCYDEAVCWKSPVTGQLSGPTDAAIVATHMLLEAASLGVGSVWISYFDQERARELLQIPQQYVPLCMLYFGYPAEDFKPNQKLSGKRYPIDHTCFDNSYTVPYQTEYHDTFKDVRLHY